MKMIDECSSAYVNRFFGILFQDSRLPGIFSEFTISVDVRRCLDTSINSLGVSGTALSSVLNEVLIRKLWPVWSSATDVARTALLLLLLTYERLALKKEDCFGLIRL
jgi:hypothetical protein